MKPRVYSADWTNTANGSRYQRWHVEFEDSCGCREESDFSTFAEASRFAYHLAMGGSRWEFVA